MYGTREELLPLSAGGDLARNPIRGGGAYISIRVVESNRINIFSYGSATALDGILRVYPVKIY